MRSKFIRFETTQSIKPKLLRGFLFKIAKINPGLVLHLILKPLKK